MKNFLPLMYFLDSSSISIHIDSIKSNLNDHESANKLLELSNDPTVFPKVQKILTDYLDNTINNSFLESFIKSQEKYLDWVINDSLIIDSGFEKKEYLITAIVSTYKSDEFIHECLADLENQTISDKLEIIIIDADSPGQEKKIVEEYQNKFTNIRYIKTKTRVGIYAAWNLAMKAATGKFITPFSTNDRLNKNAYEILSNSLIENPDIMLVYGDTHLTEIPHSSFDNFIAAKVFNGAFRWPKYQYFDLLQTCMIGPHPMWREEITNYIGYFHEKYIALGDQDYWLRIGEKFKMLHVNEFTGLYYFNESGLSIQSDNMKEAHVIHKIYQNRFLLRNNFTFEEALKNHYRNIDELNKRGEQYYKISDFKNAFKCFKEVIDQNPKHFKAYTNLGIISKQFGDIETAYYMFLHAVVVNPIYIPALKELWNLSSLLNKKEETLPYIQKALELNPNLTEIKELLISTKNKSE